MSEYSRPFPDTSNRNQSQFWVFQNKESATKSFRQPSYIEAEIDGCFNLTNTYRLDSDIVRPFETAENAILKARFHPKSGELLQDDASYYRGKGWFYLHASFSGLY